MATIRPNAEPPVTVVAGGDIFLIDGATGVRALAASVVPLRDANGNVAVNSLVQGLTSTATAAGTTVLTAASTATQLFTGSTTQIVTLPVTSTLALNQTFTIQNASSGALTVNSSGGNLVATVAPGTTASIKCILLTGTTAASWSVKYDAVVVATGKVLTANNSLTLAGTDGTTQTFPTTSATIARTDAGQTFTGTNAFGVLTATSVNGLTVTASTGVLTIAAAKTLTVNNSLTFTGTDATSFAFPGTSDTVVTLAATQVLTGKTFDTAGAGNVFKINGVTISTNTGTGSNVLGTTPTLSQPNIVGTTTNDSAAAGSVGEYVSSTVVIGSAVGLTTTTPANVTSISLTAGDWEVEGIVQYTGGASTTLAFVQNSVSTTTGTQDTSPDRFAAQSYNNATQFSGTGTITNTSGPSRFSLSGTTTVFMVARANFATSTCSAYGTLRARRVR